MRADVKFGIVLSMVVVSVAGGYYLYRDQQELPIPLTKVSPNQMASPSSSGQANSVVKKNSRQATRKTPAKRSLNKKIASKNNTAGHKTSPQIARKNNALSNRGGVHGPTQSTNRPFATKTKNTSANQMAPLNGKMRQTKNPTNARREKQIAANRKPAQNQNRSLIAKKAIPTVAIETHRVQPGDSFASLSKMYYGHERYTQFLMSQNPQITNPNALKIGVAIKIPPAPTPRQAKQSSVVTSNTNPSSRKVYVVRSGDSFYRIAQQQLGDANRWEEVFNLNKDVVKGDPKKLRPGQKIVLP